MQKNKQLKNRNYCFGLTAVSDLKKVPLCNMCNFLYDFVKEVTSGDLNFVCLTSDEDASSVCVCVCVCVCEHVCVVLKVLSLN